MLVSSYVFVRQTSIFVSSKSDMKNTKDSHGGIIPVGGGQLGVEGLDNVY